MVFLRLTGGRRDLALDHRSEVAISGDPELGGQLVANLAFTI
jgi:hypothetical protein